MIAEKKVESLDGSSAQLTVTIDKETAQQEYQSLLDKYSKTAQIKGFRKGKVPPRILEQKFGESIKNEAERSLIESGLKEAFVEVEQKPLQFEPPSLKDEVKLELGEDFTFTVTYDVYPEIKLGEYEKVEVEKPTVSITEEDVNRELEQLRDQNSIVMDKEEGAVENEDIVTVDHVELDSNDEPLEDTRREDFTFAVGTGHNRYHIDEELIGMNIDDEKVLEKKYPEDFEDPDLAGKSLRLHAKIKQIKQKQLPELDDELAQDVSEEYETLDDLKKDLNKRLKEYADNLIRQRLINEIMSKIIEASTIELPDSMVNAELSASWRDFLNQTGTKEEVLLEALAQQGRSREDLYAEWRPSVEESVKRRLVMHKIRKKEGIEATDEEVEEEIRRQAENSNVDYEQARQNFEQAGMLDYIRNQIADRKLQDYLLEKAETKKGKKLKYLDLLQDNQ